MTAELGRQPWIVYGLMRTSEGYSNTVSVSNGLFTLLGFMGSLRLAGSPVYGPRLPRDQQRPGAKNRSHRAYARRRANKCQGTTSVVP